jgi:FdhD protein
MTVPHGSSTITDVSDNDGAIRVSPSLHWSEADGWTSISETVVTEAPLATEIAYERNGREIINVLAVTMRTPGHDPELAIGFLRAEGIISNRADIQAITTAPKNARGENVSTQRVRLVRAPREDLHRISRGLVTSSACGLCGRISLEGIPLQRADASDTEPPLSGDFIVRLPNLLRELQVVFAETGGSHGAALCDAAGRVLLVREDVGRHNAVDKILGAALLRDIAGAGKIIVLSGRASFELVQKAAAAGIPIIVAVGAPSSLAITLAHAANVTLIGFTRAGRFNVYAHAERLDLRDSSNPSGSYERERVDTPPLAHARSYDSNTREQTSEL